ncbi:MAG: pyridoxamine 5'-phosphate oxidase family protein [Henriciella sp.]|nr:pyridoxamine 5'-phosphate oxidase family protein [Henriciella sp.]
MPKLTEEIKAFAAKQRLGFLATVCPDGSPNLSPKGLTFVYDATRIVIGDVRSPGTIANLRANPVAELNIVDRNTRKGFRFKGTCQIHTSGADFDRFLTFLRAQGASSDIASVIEMTVTRVRQVISPAYDNGASEADIERRFRQHYADEPDTSPGK